MGKPLSCNLLSECVFFPGLRGILHNHWKLDYSPQRFEYFWPVAKDLVPSKPFIVFVLAGLFMRVYVFVSAFRPGLQYVQISCPLYDLLFSWFILLRVKRSTNAPFVSLIFFLDHI